MTPARAGRRQCGGTSSCRYARPPAAARTRTPSCRSSTPGCSPSSPRCRCPPPRTPSTTTPSASRFRARCCPPAGSARRRRCCTRTRPFFSVSSFSTAPRRSSPSPRCPRFARGSASAAATARCRPPPPRPPPTRDSLRRRSGASSRAASGRARLPCRAWASSPAMRGPLSAGTRSRCSLSSGQATRAGGGAWRRGRRRGVNGVSSQRQP
mmetsp:Transcript_39052/g.123238  ORF Transcript_39052/g.123238 Transcript_39052/m.123238 type:complete len:210 (+) Transcript_39052:861-1490(+)